MHQDPERTCADKEQHLRELLRASGRVVVAFSGGIDSAVLLAVAHQELGDGALGVLVAGPSLPSHDLEDARRLADLVGARFEVVAAREQEDERYLANGPDRCYWCRAALVETLRPIAEREKAAMVYGAVVDDLGDDRPGMRAAEEGGIRAPLLEAGLTKRDVREIARRLGLPVWDKPASACLSSRIPTGVRITPERLARVDRAEAALRSLGFGLVRVRDHDDLARIECDEEGLARLADPSVRAAAARAVREAGFVRVAVDLEGYRPAGLAVRRLPVASSAPAPGDTGPQRG